MKLNKSILQRCSLLATLTLLLFVVLPRQASAASLTWDGGGSDRVFSNPLNWSGDVAPSAYANISIPYDVVFAGGCASDITLTNDLDVNTFYLGDISFTGSRPSQCHNTVIIAGSAIKTIWKYYWQRR